MADPVHNFTSGQSIPCPGGTCTLDSSESLATGLIAAFIASQGSGTTWNDFGGGNLHLTLASASMWALTQNGYEVSTQNTPAWEAKSTDDGYQIADADEATFALWFKSPTSTLDLDAFMGQVKSAAWGAGWGVHIETISGTKRIVAWIGSYNSANKVLLNASLLPPAGEQALLVFRVDRTTTPGSTILRVTLHTQSGGRTDAQSAAFAAPSINDNALTQYVGGLGSGGGPLRGAAVYGFTAWRRLLTSGDIDDFIKDPARLAMYARNAPAEYINPRSANGDKRWHLYRPTTYNAKTGYSHISCRGTHVSSMTRRNILEAEIGVNGSFATYARYGAENWKEACDADGNSAAVVIDYDFTGGGDYNGASGFANQSLAVAECESVWTFIAGHIKKPVNTDSAKVCLSGWSSGCIPAFLCWILLAIANTCVFRHGQFTSYPTQAECEDELDGSALNTTLGVNSYTWTTPIVWAFLTQASAATPPAGPYITTARTPSVDWRTKATRGSLDFYAFNASNDGNNPAGGDLYYKNCRGMNAALLAAGYGRARQRVFNQGAAAPTEPENAPDGYLGVHSKMIGETVAYMSSGGNEAALPESTWVDPDAPTGPTLLEVFLSDDFQRIGA